MMNREKELREAREAGARALNSLREAKQHMDSARGWGLLDIFGGGMLTTMIKHSKMDNAKDCIRRAQWDLQAFSQELRDVNLEGVELDGFSSFADYFFDGFLADMMVQSRINRAREQLDVAIRRVEDILRQLREMH